MISLPAGFISRMRPLLGPDWERFTDALETPLRRGLRLNPLKIDPAKAAACFSGRLSPAPFAENGYYLEGDLKAGADPLHHAGAYYMQEPSAMGAVTALDPRPGERVLDLCAAPGGKSTQIAAALGGKGLLWCNEYVRPRASVLMQNLERCGVRNAVVTSLDAAPLCGEMEEAFDAVLCDLPCSGEGMFRKEPAALTGWSEEVIARCAERGRYILEAAAGAVRAGGRLMMATCTFAPEENEQNAAWFLSAHPEFEPVDLSCLSFGSPALPPYEQGRRIWPWQGGEGHFLALFRKRGDAPCRWAPYAPPKRDPQADRAAALYASLFVAPPEGTFVTVGDKVRLLPADMPAAALHLLSAGIGAAEVKKDRLSPVHSLFAAAAAADCRRSVEPADPLPFLRGETVPCDPVLSGFTAVTAAGAVCGFGKAVGGTLKNHYPKGLRIIHG